MTGGYHHGDLPDALRASAVELIAEVGPAGFRLREVARRAGVSHTAPAHHFGDAQGLLTSVAAEGFATLADNMRQATEGLTDPYERLMACGRAYVSTALANPGHYSLMITHHYTDENDEHLQACGLAAYSVLLETVELMRATLNEDLDVEQTATLLWAWVHGLVEISGLMEHVAGAIGTKHSNIDHLLETLTHTAIDGVRKPR